MIEQVVHLTNGQEVRLLESAQVNKDILQCLHDDDTHWKDRNGLPETYPFFTSLFVTLDQLWQQFWFEQFKICSPQRSNETVSQWLTRLKKAYAGVIKDGVCFTDRHAPQNGYADYINNVNTGSGRGGIGYKTITTGGNLMHKIGGLVSKGGEPHWPVEMLDSNQRPPDPRVINRKTRPDLIGAATVRTWITLPNGLRRVDPFPQLGGDDVPCLHIAPGGVNFIRASWVRTVGPFENPSPYVR